jgi:4-amino-4-deoxy-L-arabinose transferase-like glycosyltransferase
MRRFDFPVIIALAAVLRFAMFSLWTPVLVTDAADYDRLARGLLEGRGYVNTAGVPTSWRPPLYPVFVAMAYAVSDGSMAFVRLIQIGVDLGTVACVYAITRSLFTRAVALVAAICVAMNVGTAAATSRLLSETLFTAFLVAAVGVSALWIDSITKARAARAATCGIALGILLAGGTLTRGILLLYPFVLVILAVVSVWRPVFDRRRAQAAMVASLAMVFAFCATLAPWTIRNYKVHHAFIPVATQLGATLYGAFNPPHGWIFGMHPRDEVTEAAAHLPEAETSAALTRATLDSIRASPSNVLRLEVLKIVYLWVPLDWEILPIYGVFNPTYAFIGFWAFVYGVRRVRQRPQLLATAPAWLPIVYFVAVALVFYGSPRFRLPMEPLLAMFAAAELILLSERLGARRAVAVVTATVCCSGILFFAVVPLKDYVKQRMFSMRDTASPLIVGRVDR